MCRSEPGALEFLIEDKRNFFAIMQPFDFMILWPYDGGGCYSVSCTPLFRLHGFVTNISRNSRSPVDRSTNVPTAESKASLRTSSCLPPKAIGMTGICSQAMSSRSR